MKKPNQKLLKENRIKALYLQGKYLAKIFLFFPHTYFKRVVFGNDPIWRDFFFESWGFLPRNLRNLAAKKKNIWINTDAGGELIQINSFCRLIKKEFPNYNLFLSTHNYQAFKLAQKIEGLDFVFFSPWDIKLSVKRILRYINPKILIIIENVIAPLLLKQAYKIGCQTILCNGFMSKGIDRSPFLKRAMAFKFYNHFSSLGVRNKEDSDGYKKLGANPNNIKILGDMRYDVEYFRISSKEKERMAQNLGIKNDNLVLIAGSTHPGEDEIIIDAYLITKEKIPELRLILAPRFFSFIPRVEKYLRKRRLNFVRKSKLGESVSGEEVIILDTFGDLAHLYAIASFAFVGSSLFDNWGGHNVIESLIQGIPIFYGPNVTKDREIIEELQDVWNGFEIRSSKELAKGIIYLYRHPEMIRRIRNKCDEIVEKNKNSAKKHIHFIKEISGE